MRLKLRVALLAILVVSVATACFSSDEKGELPAPFYNFDVTALHVFEDETQRLRFVAGDSDNIAVTGDDGEWGIVQRNTGYVYEFAETNDYVFAATQQGVFSSSDGGMTWTEMSNGQFSGVSEIAASEISGGDPIVAIVGTHIERGRGTFATVGPTQVWRSAAGGPDRSISILDDNTLMGAREDAIVWLRPASEPSWKVLANAEEVGVASISGADIHNFTAFLSSSDSQRVSVLTIKDGDSHGRSLPYYLAERPLGCGPTGSAYGSSSQCFQEVVSAQFSNGVVALISSDGPMISRDDGQNWISLSVSGGQRVYAAAWFADELYAATNRSEFVILDD